MVQSPVGVGRAKRVLYSLLFTGRDRSQGQSRSRGGRLSRGGRGRVAVVVVVGREVGVGVGWVVVGTSKQW